MQQVLFHIPFTNWLVPPDGVPVASFGVMLFLAFVLTAVIWGPRRCVPIGMPKDKLLDLAIVLFLTGIAGARLVYMIQKSDEFPDKSPLGLFQAFFQIWKGGIVFYGAVFGGVLGFIVFYRRVIRKLQVPIWKLADGVAPLIALGLLVGRMGCYLNGCCWGQAVCPECQEVPLSATLGEFPLLPAHARNQVVRPYNPEDQEHRLPFVHGLQTSTGFSIGNGNLRSTVQAVEPGSAARAAGLLPGDKIVEVNGQSNLSVLEIMGDNAESVMTAIEAGKKLGGVPIGTIEQTGSRPPLFFTRLTFENPAAQQQALLDARAQGLRVYEHDALWEIIREWPSERRGQKTLKLVVDRRGERIPISFAPRTVPFYPTQVYEMVSMFFLILLLLAYQPFRRHDGQLIVLLMLGYASHRFLNESIRIEPTYALGLTLSQWISIGIAAAAIGLEIYLRNTQPKRQFGPWPKAPPATAVATAATS